MFHDNGGNHSSCIPLGRMSRKVREDAKNQLGCEWTSRTSRNQDRMSGVTSITQFSFKSVHSVIVTWDQKSGRLIKIKVPPSRTNQAHGSCFGRLDIAPCDGMILLPIDGKALLLYNYISINHCCDIRDQRANVQQIAVLYALKALNELRESFSRQVPMYCSFIRAVEHRFTISNFRFAKCMSSFSFPATRSS